MSGPITWEQIVGLLSVTSIIGGMWWFLQKQITAGVKALDEYKLHVAEKYLAREGISDWKSEILAAMAGLKEDIRHLSGRIDGLK